MLFAKVKKFDITIYNRWGHIIFHSAEPLKGWDGKVKGLIQDSGVFVWTCTYQMEGEAVKNEQGTVVIIQ